MVRETSHLKDLVDYVKKNIKKGYSKESLKWALVKQGNMKHEIDKAFQLAETELARESPTPRQSEPKMEVIPKDEPIVEEKQSIWKKWFG